MMGLFNLLQIASALCFDLLFNTPGGTKVTKDQPQVQEIEERLRMMEEKLKANEEKYERERKENEAKLKKLERETEEKLEKERKENEAKLEKTRKEIATLHARMASMRIRGMACKSLIQKQHSQSVTTEAHQLPLFASSSQMRLLIARATRKTVSAITFTSQRVMATKLDCVRPCLVS